eukprot:scaffold677378_cov39-Prasinocladus_malaysianus.AAC.1
MSTYAFGFISFARECSKSLQMGQTMLSNDIESRNELAMGHKKPICNLCMPLFSAADEKAVYALLRQLGCQLTAPVRRLRPYAAAPSSPPPMTARGASNLKDATAVYPMMPIAME